MGGNLMGMLTPAAGDPPKWPSGLFNSSVHHSFTIDELAINAPMNSPKLKSLLMVHDGY